MPHGANAVLEPPFPISESAARQLCGALEHAVRMQDAAMADLRNAVETCVSELRAMGMTPEAVLMTMKALVRHTAREHPPLGYSPSHWAADGFLEQISHWSVVAYFRSTV